MRTWPVARPAEAGELACSEARVGCKTDTVEVRRADDLCGDLDRDFCVVGVARRG